MIPILLYPIKFNPIYKEKVWGGRKLADFPGRSLPEGLIGESWELSCRDDGMSMIANGELKGTSFANAIQNYGEKILGSVVIEKYGRQFPLLFKLIDAKERLSLQVHPNDDQAQAMGEPNGKEEFWYILSAKKDAKIILGLKEKASKKIMENHIQNGTLLQVVNEVDVHEGDFVKIQAGTVHALLEDILVAEIQQNSDTTFRLYDWNRNDGRPLHIRQALDVISFQPTALTKPQNVMITEKYTIETGPQLKEFQTDKIDLNGIYEEQSDTFGFTVLMCLKGRGMIHFNDSMTELNKGETVLIPAGLGHYSIDGQLSFLKTYVR